MKKKVNLLAINLNEINYRFIIQEAKRFNCRNIINFLNKKKINTYTNDKIQHKNLDPWVQNVSISTGFSSKTHKIFNLGEQLDSNRMQIWDLLCKKKYSCSVWGPMNAKLIKNNNMKIFFPDPWNFLSKPYPKFLNDFFYLPNYYAKNYLNVKFIKFFLYSLIFIKQFLLQTKLFLYFVKNSLFFIKFFFSSNSKNFIMFIIFDIISVILLKNLNKKRTDFSIIFLNSIAHFQHNNWDEKKSFKSFFLLLEKLFEQLNELEKKYDSIIIYNGFTQKKITTEYLIRPINPENFIKNLNINFKKIEQNMTNGALIFFGNNFDKANAIKILKHYKFFGYKVFEVKNINEYTIFYKIKIKFKEKNFIEKINKINRNKIIKYYNKNNKIYSYNDSNKSFYNNIKLIKTTGDHHYKGLLFYKNINNPFKKGRIIVNHHIFKIICNHFKI
jgi:hypothetical protein